MNIHQAYRQLISAISPLYGESEAQSIARIVFEDAFTIFNFSGKGPFPFEKELEGIQNRLMQNEPVQYVLGQADFYGLKLKINENVLIPRQETEELVHWILEDLKKAAKKAAVLDIGTGSGCIALAIKKVFPQAEVWAVDKSTAALEVARQNAEILNIPIKFAEIDVRLTEDWKKLGRFDIIVSNPPYIPLAEMDLMPPNVLEFEPKEALFVHDDDPLLFYRIIMFLAKKHLNPGGRLYFETNEFSGSEVVQIFENEKFTNVYLKRDLNGKERMARGEL